MIIIQNTINDISLPNDLWFKNTVKKIFTILNKMAIISNNKITSDIVVRIVNSPEIQALNYQYRNKNSPTNILSFADTFNNLPNDIKKEINHNFGDLVLCFAIIKQEAKDANKTIKQHLSHMLTHGILHLLNYDHIDDNEAKTMIALEISILTQLNISNPYQI